MRFKQLVSFLIAAAMLFTMPVLADAKAKTKTYDENTFIKMLSNRSKQQVIDMLGEPAKKQLAVKPSNAETVIGKPLESSSKPVKVEMWYYNNVVRYDAKHTYKSTELTFVNGRCSNMAFFNNR